MNIFELVGRFWAEDERAHFSANATRLYFYLVNEANKKFWQGPLFLSWNYLQEVLGIQRDTLSRAISDLKSRGLITYRKQKRKATFWFPWLDNPTENPTNLTDQLENPTEKFEEWLDNPTEQPKKRLENPTDLQDRLDNPTEVPTKHPTVNPTKRHPQNFSNSQSQKPLIREYAKTINAESYISNKNINTESNKKISIERLKENVIKAALIEKEKKNKQTEETFVDRIINMLRPHLPKKEINLIMSVILNVLQRYRYTFNDVDLFLEDFITQNKKRIISAHSPGKYFEAMLSNFEVEYNKWLKRLAKEVIK